MRTTKPKISICVPQWQVKRYITLCLRSIRKYSQNYSLDVIVVDNGSHDESLDYLRSLSWIRLIERPEETPSNWPRNVFTGWDCGIAASDAEYFVSLHSDVFVKRDGWLDPLLRLLEADPQVAGAGAWKLNLENPLYAAQKKVVGYVTSKVKQLFGVQRKPRKWQTGHYPRDYCAIYRRKAIVDHGLTFYSESGEGGGYAIAKQLWDHGYKTSVIPVQEMDKSVFHVAHGTAAVNSDKQLNHRRAQKKVEAKVANLFNEPWIRTLESDATLDGPRKSGSAAA